MASHHTETLTANLSNSTRCKRGRVCKLSHLDRVLKLQAAHYSVADIETFCEDAAAIRMSREGTMEFLRRETQQKQRPPGRLRMWYPTSHSGGGDESDGSESDDDDDDCLY
ncbi:Aste57867_5187 [Aphanomyces stellatus]|uniref:Aste57867_5187 protein n=1 Tax=Aphanomyces stellatus TaxID=120398 RepID=A0A485KF59_9STRA|nr:hypothetical protein As57867_005174 [Aphanomyces stellatus]VFT82260.1 Aste57867_5187 [Aphanomyces stellatus]